MASAQRRLFEARDAIEDVNRRAADAGAAHAALVERAGALAVEVERLEEAAAELEQRAAALAGELEESRRSVGALEASITAGERQLDADVRDLEALGRDVQSAEESVTSLRASTDEAEAGIKEARTGLDGMRVIVSDLDVARATAEVELSHLAHTCDFDLTAFPAVRAWVDRMVKQPGHVLMDAQPQLEDQVGQNWHI